MGPRRNWTKARAKLEREGACRRCSQVVGLECAHVLGRKYDAYPPIFTQDWKPYTVAPERIIPLCNGCHTAYDSRRFSLEPFLNPDEGAQAVMDAGSIGLAVARLTPRAERQAA